MAKTKHGLPQTRGFFKLRGKATGLDREKAFTYKEFDSGSARNALSFGVQTSENSTVFVNVEGYKNKEAYLFKRSEVKGQKGEQKKVPWSQRYEHTEDGFNPIGVSVGLEKDEEGKNLTETLLDFDAAKRVKELLEDNQSVFVRGDLDYSSFRKENGDLIRNKKFLAKNVYNSKDVDFEAEDFKETADFKQKIVFTGINKVEGSEEGKFTVEAKIITYSSIEDTEFIVYNTKLANQFRKALKPYQAIEVWGDILNKVETEDVEEESDVWGEEDSFKRITNNYIRELVITGADPSTIDKETFTQEIVDEAILKLRSEGEVDTGDWGSNDSTDIKDSDLPW
jgi:hypothetical protein